MLLDCPSSGPGGNRIVLIASILILSSIVISGCQSGPVLAFQGSRHYVAGSEALERGDGDVAIAELLEAARLIPHASEIQNHLGLAYWENAQLGPAKSAFERAVELDCENEAARVNLERLRDKIESSPSNAIESTQRDDGFLRREDNGPFQTEVNDTARTHGQNGSERDGG